MKGIIKMYKPMPSPNGTNFEQLYISSGPVAAYDAVGGLGGLSPSQYGRRAARTLMAKHGMACDLELDETDENVRQQEQDESDNAMEANIADLVAWCKKSLSEKDITRVVNLLLDTGGAQDAPPDFPGRPRTGGAMDGGTSPFYGSMDTASRRRVHELSTVEKHRLDELCPGLARIKCI
jgi:hypothetical protein